MPIRYLAIFLFFLACNSSASEENDELTCRAIGIGTGKDILLSKDDMEFSVKNSRRSCESRFSYEDIFLPNKKFMISAWPTEGEPGLNAQRDVFIAPSKKSEAVYIGSIPVDSTPIGENAYRSITQAGGSIHETTYLLTEKSLELKNPSKELVISDSLCVYNRESDSSCQILTGTFESPLCVYNYNGKKILKNVSSCSGLVQGNHNE